jgi:hypothetical protein
MVAAAVATGVRVGRGDEVGVAVAVDGSAGGGGLPGGVAAGGCTRKMGTISGVDPESCVEISMTRVSSRAASMMLRSTGASRLAEGSAE